MLRIAFVRQLQGAPTASRGVARPSWRPSQALLARNVKRYLADGRPQDKSGPPGPPNTTAPSVAKATPSTPESTTPIPPEKAPNTPQTPQQVQQTAPPTSIPPSAPASSTTAPTSSATSGNPSAPSGGGSAPPPRPPPPKPKKRRRFRTYILYLVTLLGLSYAGGVYYSLISDEFHDFFTENIPGGEEAVLFFEEREFKRRFPNHLSTATKMHPQVRGENKVTISGKSGASARVAGESGAKDSTTAKSAPAAEKQTKPEKSSTLPVGETPKTEETSESKTAEKPKEAASAQVEKAKEKTAERKTAEQKAPKKKQEPSTEKTATESESAPQPVLSTASATASTASATPATFPPIAPVDSTNVENANDPVIQKVAQILNDIITVVNADEGASKYSSAMSKAKDDLKALAGDLATYKATESKAAEDKIKQNELEFDKSAKELLDRVHQEQSEQELRWKEEYETERERLSQTYQNKLNAEMEAAQRVADQKLRNELLEQDIKLKEAFAATIRDRVEAERDSRLSKLNELSSAVSELETLTGEWNEVVDANLRTQHLVVAVDAVRSAIQKADRPRPFIQELAALKEVANSDRVVDAAIASINPVCYQRGVPTSAQLIDRFRRVADEVRKAALLPEDAGVASHAASFFLSKMLFRKQGLAVGEDVESILSRTETLLEEGNLDDAAREMNGLTGWAKVLSQDWLLDCRRVLEVKQALDVIATEARLQSLMVE